MSADKIIEKILSNAEEDVRTIEAEGLTKQTEAVNAIEAQTRRHLSDLEKKQAADLEEVRRRSELITRLDIRKQTLAVKRSVIDDAFSKARQALNALPDDRWAALIAKIVVEGVQSGNEKLLVPAGQRSRYTDTFIDGKSMMAYLKDALKNAGKPDSITLSDVDAPFDGGVLLEGEESDVNGSFDGLIQNVRETYEHTVYEQLFETEV